MLGREMQPNLPASFDGDVDRRDRAHHLPVGQSDQVIAMRAQVDLARHRAANPVGLAGLGCSGGQLDIVMADRNRGVAFFREFPRAAAQDQAIGARDRIPAVPPPLPAR